jgi:hypothetical protein
MLGELDQDDPSMRWRETLPISQVVILRYDRRLVGLGVGKALAIWSPPLPNGVCMLRLPACGMQRRDQRLGQVVVN